ncbi:ABC transporter substrate-binding protein [Defluviitalea phaphyphila]|uniref:ABC transporter substrate-binding protein n=1 Tax=Defluviitalea phaphyphila TaxID=1473580 RepID=UPI000730BCEF|nr:extracellular solute-binding protein [Defluviitalea phaphyphila]
MKKKLLASLLIVIMSVFTLAGCGNKSDDSNDSSANNNSKTSTNNNNGETSTNNDENEKVTITIMDAYAPEDPHGQYVYEYAEAFMKENPNITVEIQAISSNDIYTKVAAMASSKGELPTMFWTSADQIPTLFDLGVTADLNEILDEETLNGLANGVQESCILDGEMTYYPVAVAPVAVIYRKDRFEEEGLEVPTTWEEFIDSAKKLTKDTDGDGVADQWGFSMVGSNNSSGQSRFMAYLWSNGFDLVKKDDNGKWVTDISLESDFAKAFSTWTDMNNVHNIVPTGITEVDYSVASTYFAMGYTSMFLSGSNALGVAYSNNPELEGKLGSFKLPGIAPGSMLSGEGYVISDSATDAQKEAAAKYLKFFVSNDKDLKFWQSSGKIPATTKGQEAEYISGDDYAGYLQQIADGCRSTSIFPGISGLKSALGDAYSAVFSNEKTNEEAIESLQKEVNNLLEDYN